jgi:hypothetical protein
MAKLGIVGIPIKNKKFLNPDVLEAALEGVLREGGEGVKKDFQATTRTWKTKVVFVLNVRAKQGYALVFTRNASGTESAKIYDFVNEGTRPHLIRPVRAKLLVFQQSYSPKTSPGVIGSGTGGPSGGTVVARTVKHPGSKGRHFVDEIAKKWAEEFPPMVDKAIKESGAI